MKTLILSKEPSVEITALCGEEYRLSIQDDALVRGLLDLDNNDLVVCTGAGPPARSELLARAEMLRQLVLKEEVESVYVNVDNAEFHYLLLEKLQEAGLMVFDSTFGTVLGADGKYNQ